MRESTELKATILHESEELFMTHGFAGTSIKQIATASGCTSAALYYYFPAGKTEIMREVVRCSFSPEATAAIHPGQEATSLDEWLRAFGYAAMQKLIAMQRRISWIEQEMHQLGTAEQTWMQQHALLLHQTIAHEIARFVVDPAKAGKLAWLLMCAVFGYGQLFINRGMQQVSDFDTDVFVETLVATVGKVAE